MQIIKKKIGRFSHCATIRNCSCHRKFSFRKQKRTVYKIFIMILKKGKSLESRNFKKANKTFLSDLKKQQQNRRTDKQTDIKHKRKNLSQYAMNIEYVCKCCFFFMCLYERQVKKISVTPLFRYHHFHMTTRYNNG